MSDLYIIFTLLVLNLGVQLFLFMRFTKRSDQLQAAWNEYLVALNHTHKETAAKLQNITKFVTDNRAWASDDIGKLREENKERFKMLIKQQITTADTQVHIQDLIGKHLKKVEEVVAAAIPNMAGSELTPANVAQAIKELDEDNEFNSKMALKELENWAMGLDNG